VRAQFALLRLFKGTPEDANDARDLFNAVKTGEIKGIFGDDLAVSAKLAAERSTVRWELVPPGQDAVMLQDESPDTPVIIFKEAAGQKPRLDQALLSIFREHRGGTGLLGPSPFEPRVINLLDINLDLFLALLDLERRRQMANAIREVVRMKQFVNSASLLQINSMNSDDLELLSIINLNLKISFLDMDVWNGAVDLALGLMRENFRIVPKYIRRQNGFFGCTPEFVANATPNPDHVINICPAFSNEIENCNVAMLMHEVFHLQGIGHGEMSGKVPKFCKITSLPPEALNSACDMASLSQGASERREACHNIIRTGPKKKLIPKKPE
jgi:hypothetical protein